MQVDEIQSLIDTEIDTNIFSMELDAELYQESSQADESKGETRDYKPEIFAQITEGTIAMAEPARIVRDTPIYAFPNTMFGKRKVTLTRMDRNGHLYCNVNQPSQAEVHAYIETFPDRARQAKSIGEKLSLYTETSGLRKHLCENKDKYPKDYLTAIDKIRKPLATQCDLFLAEKTGEILKLEPGNLDRFAESWRRMAADMHGAPPTENYCLTYQSSEGAEPLIIFSISTSLQKSIDGALDLSNPCITIQPLYIFGESRKGPMSLLAKRLAMHNLTEHSDAFLLSSVRFPIPNDVGTYVTTTKGPEKRHIYKLNHLQ